MSQEKSIETVNETRPPFSDYCTISEAIKGWPELIRKGFQLIPLCPGLTLLIVNFQSQENFMVKSDQLERSLFEFSFYLSGTVKCEYTYGLRQRDEYVTEPGKMGLWFVPRPTGALECSAGQPVRWVSVRIEPQLFNTILEGEFDQIPPDLRGIVDGSIENYYKRIGAMTASIQMAIHQILNCPYGGSIKRIYLESKAMELISHQLAKVALIESGRKNPSVLRPDDIERIHEARDILIRNLQDPPSLLDLAWQVGLNDTKLKRGFRQIFGTTVFGYLQLKRLERGRELLEEGQMNITEVAYARSYSSLAHFTPAFVKHFPGRKKCGKIMLFFVLTSVIRIDYVGKQQDTRE